MPHLGHAMAVVASSECECENSTHILALVEETYIKAKRQLYEQISTYIRALPSNLRSHAFMPSAQLWSTFSLIELPQFLNQAPPGAQQLTLPDFLNVPHFGHVVM